MMLSWQGVLKSFKDDNVLGDGWAWSRTNDRRVSSDNWRMTAQRDAIEVRPASELRGGLFPVHAQVGDYAVMKMIILTRCENIEQSLDRVFTTNQ